MDLVLGRGLHKELDQSFKNYFLYLVMLSVFTKTLKLLCMHILCVNCE